MYHKLHRAPLTIALAIALSACGGGGGGGTKSNPPPPPAPPAPPAEPANPTPPPAPVCEDQDAQNPGGPLPCTYRYSGRGDNILVPANLDLAHAAGFTGKGVKVGILDGAHQGDYAPLEGRFAFYKDYTGQSEYDKRGHGTVVATVLGGKAVEGFKGGAAPEADLYYGVTCYDGSCSTSRASKAVNEMLDQGVRIFNWSMGQVSATEAEIEVNAASYEYWLGNIAWHNALLIVAAGNEGLDRPSDEAFIPHYQPHWYGRLLAVASVAVDEKGAVTGLADYSNACGTVASSWCVVAPGLVSHPPVVGTEFDTGGAKGTSFATPIVTATAALVQQAYPWMTGQNISQTILTTATDLGSPELYGRGLVNAEKAVKGPGLGLVDFVADVPSGSYEFFNDVSGEAFIKRGDGRLVLSGNATFSFLTRTDAGELVAHNLDTWQLVVGRHGTFVGGGKAGSLVVFENSTTALTIGKPLEVEGKATLEGGTLKLLAPAEGYEVGSTERLINWGSYSGAFDDVTYGSGFFYSAALNYGDDALTATLTRNSASASASAAGSAPLVVQGGAMADTLFGVTDGLQAGTGRDGIRAMAAQLASASTVAQAEASLASLTGEVHGTARAVAVQQAVAADQLLADRVATIDPASAGVWVSGSSLDGAFERTGFADADYRSNSLTVGVDRQFGDVLVGGALTTGRNKADLDAVGGRFEANTAGASLYGNLTAGKGYVSATATYGRSSVDTHRTLVVGGSQLEVDGSHKDRSTSARIEAGRGFGFVTPFAAAGWIDHEQGHFAEEGGQGLALAAGSDSATVRYGEVGVRFQHALARLSFRGLVAGRWLGGDTRAAFDAWFADAPEAVVKVAGQSVPDRALRASAGLVFASSPRSRWSLDVGAENADGDSSNAYVTAGYRYSF